ncbi:MAG: hypothetical protein IT452_23690 [Planctomycetia bacterium]|nr:hypothetical protein [Planctomycetia bacterium]
MERRAAIPLSRRLGPLEVVDSAIWFARDHAASVLGTAGTGSLAFAFAVVVAWNRLTGLPAGSEVSDHLPELAAWGAGLSALFLARGLGHWAAVVRLAASLRGEEKPAEECWTSALRNAPAALFLAGVPAMGQWAGLLLIWPGLSMMNRWSNALAAAIFERTPPVRALRRSMDLMRGSIDGMAVWGVLLVAWSLVFVNTLVAGATIPGFLRSFFGLNLPRLEEALAPSNGLFVVAALAASWAACDALRTVAFAILYLNARIEREGGDLLTRLETFRAGRRAAVAAREEAHA